MKTDPVLVYITQHPGCTSADIHDALGMDESGVYRAARDLCARGSIAVNLVRCPRSGRHRKGFFPASAAAPAQPALIAPPALPPSAQRFRVRTTVDLTIGGHTIPMDLSEIRDLVDGLQEVLAQHAN